MSIIQKGDILLSESSLIEEKIASLYGQISRTRKESVSKHKLPHNNLLASSVGCRQPGHHWRLVSTGGGTWDHAPLLHCSTRPRPGHTATTTCTNTDQQPRGQYPWIPYIISGFVCTSIIHYTFYRSNPLIL